MASAWQTLSTSGQSNRGLSDNKFLLYFLSGCEGDFWRVQDPEGFVESGGWDFLDAEGGDDDEEGEDSEEEGARPGLCVRSTLIDSARELLLLSPNAARTLASTPIAAPSTSQAARLKFTSGSCSTNASNGCDGLEAKGTGYVAALHLVK